ncbi:hypothetical protein FE257_004453 [Aspergillus nanangensis]|uniref:Uncharacterized protein n=1 Tax=Aspergillus nanangensis TaxID=2582783 RepID=A0AAD4CYG0_ASPNN|nr:hypothetical protein FE257_004453 [Aspergillus nanangensis]
MRFSIASAAATLFACAASHPIASRSTSMFNVDWTKAGAMSMINSLMEQLPVDVHFWALNQTQGYMGVSVDVDMNDLVDMGIVSMSKNMNAKVSVNVTISGLDQ